MKPVLTHPSWYQIDKGCALLANQIIRTDYKPDVIVGLARGGLIPAVILSHILCIKMFPVSYSSKAGNGEYKEYDNTLPDLPFKKLLIVDDIADTGNTLKEVVQHYTNKGHEIQSAVLYYKAGASIIRPSYFWQEIPANSDWIIFPFEV